MTTPVTIDTKMHGLDGITGAFILAGSKTALLETGPKSSLGAVLQGLTAAGIEDLDWIVVTHIHLDHAGAAGTLAQHFPNARVAVHRAGAPHLIDPSKLWRSAARIYGDAMEALWGGIDPIDEDRVLVLDDGDEIDLGDRKLRALATPGHAGHHHAFLDESNGDLFTGDALGVRLPGVPIVRPATPPPEFDLEAALASIERLRGTNATRPWLTHFGAPDDVALGALCDQATESLNLWNEWVVAARGTTTDVTEAASYVADRAREHAHERYAPDVVERLEQTTSTWMNTWGYMRYHDKRASE